MSSSFFERIGRAVMGSGPSSGEDGPEDVATSDNAGPGGKPFILVREPGKPASAAPIEAKADPEVERLKAFHTRQVAAVPVQARAFAERAVAEHGYTPAERPYLAAAAGLLLSAELQGQFPQEGVEVALNDGGKVTVASASDLLGRLVAERPKSPLTREQMKAVKPVPNGSESAPSEADQDAKYAAEWAERNIR